MRPLNVWQPDVREPTNACSSFPLSQPPSPVTLPHLPHRNIPTTRTHAHTHGHIHVMCCTCTLTRKHIAECHRHANARFVREHRTIVTTVIMECGVGFCVKNYSAPRGSPCLNNNGNGGQIAGELYPACKRALPILAGQGVRVELWLGEDDSILSARTLFSHGTEAAAALVQVAHKHPGIVGFNYDPEAGVSTSQDVDDLIRFTGKSEVNLYAQG